MNDQLNEAKDSEGAASLSPRPAQVRVHHKNCSVWTVTLEGKPQGCDCIRLETERTSPLTGKPYPQCQMSVDSVQCTKPVYAEDKCYKHFQVQEEGQKLRPECKAKRCFHKNAHQCQNDQGWHTYSYRNGIQFTDPCGCECHRDQGVL